MRDILPDLDTWSAQSKSIALATVIQTWGSSPRRAGAKMASTRDGGITGSVSGGCVEGAVFEEGVESLKANRPKLLHLGVADETAWEVGLACGGSIDIFVQALPAELYAREREALGGNTAFAVVTVVGGPAELLGRGLLVPDTGTVTGSLGGDLDGPALE